MVKTTPTLSVFTPAYNRAHTLERTYKSLCRQTSHDFQWIIVDDGSKDTTRQLVESWFMNDNLHAGGTEIIGVSKDADWLKINYIYKENGGMHTAHNTAYEHIDTELAVCIDSDDWMPDDGVELIISKWRKDGSEQFAGMIGLDVFENGTVIGTKFPEGLRHLKTYDMARKYKVYCDKKYVYRPDVIKKYLPYKAYNGEKYGGVNYLYQVIDHDYDVLCYNEVFCVVEYQDDGLSNNVITQCITSPKTFAYQFNVSLAYFPGIVTRMKHAIQYVACSLIAKDKHFLSHARKKVLVFFLIPFGVVYSYYIRHKYSTQNNLKEHQNR